MGAPVGNRFAAKARQFYNALMLVCEENPDWLKIAATHVMEKAKDGDLDAIIFVRDTLDGKPKQAVDVGSDPDRPAIVKGVVEFVRTDVRSD